jgi:hypothetical protein
VSQFRLHTVFMLFLDYSHIELTPEFISHVLYGEKDNPEKGGHFSGMRRANKTEFPPEWSEEHIVLALHQVLKKPDFVDLSGVNIYLRRVVAGVEIQIVLIVLKTGLTPFAAYPLGGPGVIQNIMGYQHHIPLKNLRNGR